MKLIEKTCPKCGANLKFNKDDEKVVCEYCKKEFIIEQDDDNNDYYLYSSDIGKAIMKGSFAFVFIVAFIIIIFVVMTLFGLKSCSVNAEINKLEDISDSTRKEIYKDSKSVLNQYKTINILYKQVEPFDNIGFYLFIDDNTNTLFDVYKGVFEYNGSNKDIFVAVQFDDIKNTNMLNGKMVGEPSFDKSFKYGYESNEELYNYLISTTSHKKILSSGDLYIK